MSSESTLSSSSTRHHYKRAHRRSILSSTGSDIRFTRKKLTHHYKLGCIIIAIFLILLLFAAGAVYVGFSYFNADLTGPLVYRGTLKIIDGDFYTNDLADTSSKTFKNRSRDYRERLNLLYKRSRIKYGFTGSEILALDGTENKDLVIHFTLNVDPAYTGSIDKTLLENIILNEIKRDRASSGSIIFKNLKIDEDSISIIPNYQITTDPPISTEFFTENTERPEVPKECVPIDLKFCSKTTNYKMTSYPNIFGYKNVEDVKNNLIPFRELIDAECYNHTYQFVCNILQPYCIKTDVSLMPCRSFCRYFMNGCGHRLTGNVREILNCNNFLEYEGDNCIIEPDCGKQKPKTSQFFSKTAEIGDWPWHVALFKENVHICDGTLISPSWIATTSSCFQGQPKAEWIARFGTIRLSMKHPSETERRIVGMIKSPVEGSTIALVKLDEPIMINDNIRPICLPKRDVEMIENGAECNTVGWSRDTEQLKRIQVKVTSMEKCENISISNMNSVCAQVAYGEENCHEEEFAGSPIVCVNPKTSTWSIVGITNWRIACSKNGMIRPRMYDKISSNINWIHETLSADE